MQGSRATSICFSTHRCNRISEFASVCLLFLSLIVMSQRMRQVPIKHQKLRLLTCFNLVLAWISNFIRHKVYDDIVSPFPNINDATIEVWIWINDVIGQRQFIWHVIKRASEFKILNVLWGVLYGTHTHTHTHTYIYIYIYITSCVKI